MLPDSVEKLIIIDTDCLVVSDVRYFWEEFENFTAEKGEVSSAFKGNTLRIDRSIVI